MNLFTHFVSCNTALERPALRLTTGATISYQALFADAARFANALVGLGVRPGDRVAAQIDKSPEFVSLYLGCLRAGAVFLPLNTAYTQSELAYFIADASPALVIGRPDSGEVLRNACRKAGVTPAVETMDAQRGGSLIEVVELHESYFSDVPRRDDDVAAILYTSGTTGRSKGAMLTHGNLRTNCVSLCGAWRFSPSDVLIHALPVFHTHGLFVGLNVTLTAGSSCIFLPAFDAKLVLRLFKQATCLMGVPTFYTRLLQEPALDRQAIDGMRMFVSGSAPLLAETHQLWRERTGTAILERYGMTETNMITSNPYDGIRKGGTVGMPLRDVEVRIVDTATGEALPADQVGMIEIRGPNVFAGYWGMPEKTAQEFTADGFFISGDLGSFDGDGYLSIVGRSKDLIISGGYNVYPKEIEVEIDDIAGVAESAVIGLPHPDFGEGVVAVVVPMPQNAVSEAGVLSALAGRLARYKLPKRVFVTSELPRNAMGKVQKNLLREQFAAAFSHSTASSHIKR